MLAYIIVCCFLITWFLIDSDSRHLNRSFKCLEKLVMATIEEVQSKLDTLLTAVANEKAEVVSAVDALKVEIERLKALVATGAATPEQLGDLVTKLETATAAITDLITPDAPPA